ncbi:MAG TPA: citramalate synthase [Candidatus Sulfopaludibacter sp.]|jgi:2-isopropylmalate synthase|nr:citramalate synthase [Candidatus Sulfopaludibacter sp.]
MKIFTFDTTLRDGTQGEAVSFSVDDKLIIAQKLDELGIDYIEGGWPGSNPKDKEFFSRAAELNLKHAKLTAFGSTRFAKNPVEQDRNVLALVEAGTPVVSIFGKTWDLHVKRALGITNEENLRLIADTVKYLVDHGKEVVYDAEHFFDGYLANPAYAIETLEAAKQAGAFVLCLCDTNGGTPTSRLVEIVTEVRKRFDGVIGIHTHNDSDVAVANTLAAVEAGATHVQGCMNGYGERCGNANLASVIANLELKLGHTTVGADKLTGLASVCRFISELANLPLRNDQPFVGKSAFAHKGGVHVSAVLKDSHTYEHIAPETVGNRQRVLVSDLSGRGNILYKLKQHGLADRLDEDARRELLERIKQMEYEGYELEAAEGTFELLVREALKPGVHFFDVDSYEVATRTAGAGPSRTTATVTLRTQDGVHSATEDGHGPFNALHLCLRKCLSRHYPQITEVRLTDYKVRVLDSRKGTAANVRVLIEWSDHRKSWSTVGVSENVIEASWKALVDAIRLELMRLTEKDSSVERAVEDYCWGV